MHELLRFAISGLASTLFYISVAWLLVVAGGMEPTVGSVVSYVLSLAVSYSLQSRFTFRAKGRDTAKALKFLLTALLGLLASYGLVFLTTEVLHWWFIIGNAAVCVFIPIANYFVFKLWVFGSEKIGASGDE